MTDHRQNQDPDVLDTTLLATGRERGYLSFDEVCDALVAQNADLNKAVPKVMRQLESGGIALAEAEVRTRSGSSRRPAQPRSSARQRRAVPRPPR